jgi:hypothetical protein
MTTSRSLVLLPKQTSARLKGNVAEAYIQYELSKFAIVHKIEQNGDFGIDFFCELTQEEHPYLPFFVQCKGKERATDKPDFYLVKGVKATTLNYWLRQRFPVYLFVVDLQRRDKGLRAASIAWLSFTQEQQAVMEELRHRQITRRSTLELRVPKANTLDDPRSFRDRVVADYCVLCHREGYVPPIPQLRPSYIQTTWLDFPSILRNARRIRQTSRKSVLALARAYLNEDTGNAIKHAQLAIQIDEMDADRHYENFEVLGQACWQMRDYRCAEDEFAKALASVRGDPNVYPGHPDFSQTAVRLLVILGSIAQEKGDRGAARAWITEARAEAERHRAQHGSEQPEFMLIEEWLIKIEKELGLE